MAGGAETPNIAALPAIARLGACESARGPDADRRVKLLIQFAVEGRIASPRMLLDNFSPMTGAASPNRFGGLYGGKDQHGRAARGGVGGDGALPVGQTGGEGADPRRAVRETGWHRKH